MLLQFKFKNYKSFLNETILDLRASSYKEHLENCITYRKNKNGTTKKALKVITINGANASGKSGIVEALKTMLVISTENNQHLPKNNFILCNEGRENNTLFEIEALIDQHKIKYGFEYNNVSIEKEYLAIENTKTKFYNNLYTRTKHNIKLCEEFRHYRNFTSIINDKQTFLFLLTSTIKPDNEYMKIMIEFSNWLKLSLWANESFFYNFNENKLFSLGDYLYNLIESNQKQKLLGVLKKCDFNIDDLYAESYKDELLMKKFRFFTIRKCKDTNKDIKLLLQHESLGTQKMLFICAQLFEAMDKNLLLLYDELENSLHPMLLKYLINLFYKEKNTSQLITTTHSTLLMSNNLTRRDQIYFTEKDNNGVSELFSLKDIKGVRNEAKYDKEYLRGEYDAVPDLDDDMEDLFQ